MEEVEVFFSGHDAVLKVHNIVHQKPLGKRADSDWDCYGYTDIDYTIHDEDGLPLEGNHEELYALAKRDNMFARLEEMILKDLED